MSVVTLGLVTAMAPPGTPERDCVIDAASGAEQCFGDYRAAIAYATGGAITDAPRDAHEAASEPVFQAEMAHLAASGPGDGSERTGLPARPTTTTDNPVIGATLFTGTNYTGQSETIRIAKPCVKDNKYDYYFTLGTIGRNAHSVQAWANCWIWLHSGDTWDSPRQGPYKVDTPDLGDWNGRAHLMGLS
jgi:hypothetical protein